MTSVKAALLSNSVGHLEEELPIFCAEILVKFLTLLLFRAGTMKTINMASLRAKLAQSVKYKKRIDKVGSSLAIAVLATTVEIMEAAKPLRTIPLVEPIAQPTLTAATMVRKQRTEEFGVPLERRKRWLQRREPEGVLGAHFSPRFIGFMVSLEYKKSLFKGFIF